MKDLTKLEYFTIKILHGLLTTPDVDLTDAFIEERLVKKSIILAKEVIKQLDKQK